MVLWPFIQVACVMETVSDNMCVDICGSPHLYVDDYALVYQHATTSLHVEQPPCMSSMLVVGQCIARYDVATLPLKHSILSFIQTKSISTEQELVASYQFSKTISNHFLCSTIHQLHFL
jgi:hypothetical protein